LSPSPSGISRRWPVTLRDFSWWSGLSLRDAHNALEVVKESFMVEKIGSQTWVLSTSSKRADAFEADGRSVGRLPAFDEMILSYTDRSALFGAKDALRGVVSGGVIKPIIFAEGQVVGTWNRQNDEEKVAVTIAPFGKLAATVRASIEEAAERYANFLGKPLEILSRSL